MPRALLIYKLQFRQKENMREMKQTDLSCLKKHRLLQKLLILNTDEWSVIIRMLPRIRDDPLASEVIFFLGINDLLKNLKTTTRNHELLAAKTRKEM